MEKQKEQQTEIMQIGLLTLTKKGENVQLLYAGQELELLHFKIHSNEQ